MVPVMMAEFREKRGPRIGDAASLWNFTPAPGWTREEALVLKLCLMKYGAGQWQQIQSLGLLPGKLIQQLNGQAQRLLGQQALAAFTGLQVDVDRVRADNLLRTDVQRKSGLIIYGGPPPSRQLKERWKREAKSRYGLTAEQLAEVETKLEEVGRQRLAGECMPIAGQQQPTFNDIMTDDVATMSREAKLELLRRLSSRLEYQLARSKRGSTLNPGEEIQADEGVDAEEELYARCSSGAAAATSSGPWDNRGEAMRTIEPGAVPHRSKWLGSTSRRGQGKRRAPQQPRAPRSRSYKENENEDSEAEAAAAEYESEADEGGSGREREAAPERSKRSTAGPRRRTKTAAQEALDTALEADVTTLTSMGFPKRKAKEALEACDGDLQMACDWLFSNCS